MSDFCKQCSIYMFGEDFKDLANLITKDYKIATVICEGCGVIEVNKEGECVTKNCFKLHGEEIK